MYLALAQVLAQVLAEAQVQVQVQVLELVLGLEQGQVLQEQMVKSVDMEVLLGLELL